MNDKGSILNVDGPSVLKIELHVPRPELERKFEIVLFAENARMELKKKRERKLTLTTPDWSKFRRNRSRTEGVASSPS